MEQGLTTDSLAEPSLGELLRGLDEPGLVSNLSALESRAGEIRERALKRVVDARLRDHLAPHNNRYLNLATRKYIDIGSYANETVRRDLAEAASLLGMLVVRERSIKIDNESEYFCPVTISDEDLEWLGKSAAAARTSEPVVWFHLECLRGTYQTLQYNPEEDSAVGEFFKSVYGVFKAGKGLAEIDFDPLIELWGGVKEERGRFPNSWVCPATVILWAGFDEAEYASLPRSFDRCIAKRKKPVGIGFAYAYTFLRKARAGIGREACLSRLRQLERVDDSRWAGLRTHIRAGLEAIEAPPTTPVAREPEPPVLVEPRENVAASEVTMDDEVLDGAYGRFCSEVEWVEYSSRVHYELALRLFKKKHYASRSETADFWKTLPSDWEEATFKSKCDMVLGAPLFAAFVTPVLGVKDIKSGFDHRKAVAEGSWCDCGGCRLERGDILRKIGRPIADLFVSRNPTYRRYDKRWRKVDGEWEGFNDSVSDMIDPNWAD